jgi:membrane protease YdiL (CAAX protease family)
MLNLNDDAGDKLCYSTKASLGIGVAVVLVVIATRRGETSLAQMSLETPESWLSTVLLGLLIGSGLSMLSIMLIEPLIENITKQPHDLSLVEGVRSNWKSLLVWLVEVWTLVAFGEEYLYRGSLMSQLVKLLGESSIALVLNPVVS